MRICTCRKRHKILFCASNNYHRVCFPAGGVLSCVARVITYSLGGARFCSYSAYLQARGTCGGWFKSGCDKTILSPLTPAPLQRGVIKTGCDIKWWMDCLLHHTAHLGYGNEAGVIVETSCDQNGPPGTLGGLCVVWYLWVVWSAL